MASMGRPTAPRMMAMATSDADGTPATPTDVSNAMNTIENWTPKVRSRPYAWARNMAAAHSYKAVPFMLTVAPSGKTKLEILLETPIFSSTHSIVIGNVAEDDAVENAVSIAGAIAGNTL